MTQSTITDFGIEMATDEQLEAAAGLTRIGFGTWDMTSCSGCSVSVC